MNYIYSRIFIHYLPNHFEYPDKAKKYKAADNIIKNVKLRILAQIVAYSPNNEKSYKVSSGQMDTTGTYPRVRLRSRQFS